MKDTGKQHDYDVAYCITFMDVVTTLSYIMQVAYAESEEEMTQSANLGKATSLGQRQQQQQGQYCTG